MCTYVHSKHGLAPYTISVVTRTTVIDFRPPDMSLNSNLLPNAASPQTHRRHGRAPCVLKLPGLLPCDCVLRMLGGWQLQLLCSASCWRRIPESDKCNLASLNGSDNPQTRISKTHNRLGVVGADAKRGTRASEEGFQAWPPKETTSALQRPPTLGGECPRGSSRLPAFRSPCATQALWNFGSFIFSGLSLQGFHWSPCLAFEE